MVKLVNLSFGWPAVPGGGPASAAVSPCHSDQAAPQDSDCQESHGRELFLHLILREGLATLPDVSARTQDVLLEDEDPLLAHPDATRVSAGRHPLLLIFEY